MTFSDAIKNNTDEKHLKLLSGELECTIPKIEIASLNEYNEKRSEYQKRITQEEAALKAAMQTIKDVKRAADKKERQEKERQRREEKERQEREEQERQEKERREKWEREAPKRAEARKKEERKKKKEKIKKTIIRIVFIAAIICAFIFLFRSCTGKYSANNIHISVLEKAIDTEKSMYDDGLVTCLVLVVENKGSLDILQLKGNMKVYNTDGDCLMSDTVTLNGTVESKSTLRFTLTLDMQETPKIREMYNTDLTGLKITYQLTKVTFENYKEKEYSNSKAKVINDVSKDYSEDSVNFQIREKFNEMLSAFKKADVKTDTYVEDLNAAVDLLNNVWTSVKTYDELKDELYTEGANYQSAGNYEKAYYIFSSLSSMEYKDSAKKAQDCYDEASTISYDNTKPGKSGVIIEYGVLVQEVESGYDAEGKVLRGDEIVEVDGHRLYSADDFYNALADKKAGDSVTIGLYRYGNYMTVTIKLGYKYF